MNEKLDILIVEDNPEHQESARILLASDHNLTFAETFVEGIEALIEGRPSVLLTDMMFPLGGQGYEFSSNEEPLGFAMALYAARPNIAVPRIALVTDCNHHANAAAATFNYFKASTEDKGAIVELMTASYEAVDFDGERYYAGRPVFKLNNSLFTMMDERDTPKLYLRDDKILSREEFERENKSNHAQQQLYEVKNWEFALEEIMKHQP